MPCLGDITSVGDIELPCRESSLCVRNLIHLHLLCAHANVQPIIHYVKFVLLPRRVDVRPVIDTDALWEVFVSRTWRTFINILRAFEQEAFLFLIDLSPRQIQYITACRQHLYYVEYI